MNSNYDNIKFKDKTLLINLLETVRDSHCKFKVLDDKKLKLSLQIGENEYEDIYIHFKESISWSILIYDIVNKRRKFKGKIIDKNLESDLESLNVELNDFYFDRNDLLIYANDLTPKGFGNDKIIRCSEVDSIDIDKRRYSIMIKD